MIEPVNRHILIEPVIHEAFIASQNDTYEEIGTIIAVSSDLDGEDGWTPEVGEKVYFDAWLAAKYPKKDGKDGEFYWLVKWEDVRAVEEAQESDVEPEPISP